MAILNVIALLALDRNMGSRKIVKELTRRKIFNRKGKPFQQNVIAVLLQRDYSDLIPDWDQVRERVKERRYYLGISKKPKACKEKMSGMLNGTERIEADLKEVKKILKGADIIFLGELDNVKLSRERKTK